MLIMALAITTVLVLASGWFVALSWPVKLARLWAIAWAIMALCVIEALWTAQYWRAVARSQFQWRPPLQSQFPQSQSDGFSCRVVPQFYHPLVFADAVPPTSQRGNPYGWGNLVETYQAPHLTFLDTGMTTTPLGEYMKPGRNFYNQTAATPIHFI